MREPPEVEVVVEIPRGGYLKRRSTSQVPQILEEGQFVATYKFALLPALIDIAVERGDESGAPRGAVLLCGISRLRKHETTPNKRSGSNLTYDPNGGASAVVRSTNSPPRLMSSGGS
jgi:hypothetical protein